MQRIASRMLVVFGFLSLFFLLVGCFLSTSEIVSFQIIAQDLQGRFIPGAFVEIRNRNGTLVSTGKTSEMGAFHFRAQAGRVQVLVQDEFLQYQDNLSLSSVQKNIPIVLQQQVGMGKTGITWRTVAGKLVPFLFFPPQARIVQLVTLPCKQLPSNCHTSGNLFAPPLLQREESAHLLWADTSQRTAPTLLDVSSLWDYLDRSFDPLLQVQVLNEVGNEIFLRGKPIASYTCSARPIFPNSELTRVGDISSLPGSSAVPDGVIDVWDLVFLLNNYDSNNPSADIAQILSQVTAPPSGPFCHNLDSFGPDGIVDVWDLILLFNMYGHTLETINTPFAPQITQVTSLGANQFRVDWQIPFENDCQETFVLYTLDATLGFDPNPIVNVPVGAVPSTARSYTITSTKPYVAICAYNVLDAGHYYSPPDFAVLGSNSPLPPSAPTLLSPSNGASQLPLSTQLSWQAPGSGTTPFHYNVYLGTTSTPLQVANGLSSLSYTASLSPNTTYYWKVEAVNPYGSAFSSTWHFSTTSTQPETKEWRALLVGINDYAGTSNDLQYCVNDANDLQTVLDHTNETYQVQKLLTYVTGTNLQNALQTYPQQTSSEDIFVFSFSGHGFYDDQSYVVLSDDTAWSVATLRSFLDSIEGTKVVFIDACMSGGFINLTDSRGNPHSPSSPSYASQQLFLQNILDAFSPRDFDTDSEYYVMTACRTDELSYEASSIGNGFFTFSVADGLGHVGRTNPWGSFDGSYNADSNADNQISFQELANFTTTQVLNMTGNGQHVQSSPLQTPWIFASYSGNPPPPQQDDPYEEDDTLQAAKQISFGQTQDHILADEDWVYFNANSAKTVVLDTLNLVNCDTYLKLFDSSGSLLAQDDDSGEGYASKITYSLPSSGYYYLRVSDYANRGKTPPKPAGEASESPRYSYDSSYQVRLQEGTPVPEDDVIFKIANSWGEGSWENVPDGFLYMTADAMIQNQIDSFFYLPRENYRPKAVAVFQINHPVRNDCTIEVGVGNPSSPRMVKKVYGDRDYDGPYYYAGGPYPFPTNKIVIDITEFLPIQNETVFLKVFDGNSSYQTGSIQFFAVETFFTYPSSLNHTFTATGLPQSTANGTTRTISISNVSASTSSRNVSTDGLPDVLWQASEPVTMEMVQPLIDQGNQPSPPAPSEERSHGTGLKHPDAQEWENIIQEGRVRKVNSTELLSLLGNQEVRGEVDHSLSPYFPPIGNQDGKGSCTCFSMGYYIATFYLAREFGWDLSGAFWEGGYYGAPSSAYQDYIMSPDFLYHQLLSYDPSDPEPNGGTTYVDNMELLTNIGICSWKKMPYDTGTYQSWGSETAWRQSPLYRMEYRYEGGSTPLYWIEIASEQDVQAVQSLLEQGLLVSISINANFYDYLSSEDLWDVHNYSTSASNHANTIVGYSGSVPPDQGFTVEIVNNSTQTLWLYKNGNYLGSISPMSSEIFDDFTASDYISLWNQTIGVWMQDAQGNTEWWVTSDLTLTYNQNNSSRTSNIVEVHY